MLRRLTLSITLFALAATGFAQQHIKDVIYQKREGVALTMDVFKPEKPNGAAVIWVVSGGWVSNHESINPAISQLMNAQGLTVFQVVHGTQPRFVISEINDQIQRAVRFIRTNASTYGVDPNRIGISGASAGGHLSLLAAGLGKPGNPEASDPVDRASSEIQAVVALFPPTDFQNWGKQDYIPINAPALAVFRPAFGLKPNATQEDIKSLAEKISPITHVGSKFPPTLLIHGDKDMLVPLQQSQTFVESLKKANAPHQLIVVPGAGHDFKVLNQDTIPAIVGWFVQRLK